MAITHTKVSGIADGGDANLVRPSDWNANHSLGADDNLLTDAQVAALHPAVTVSAPLAKDAGQALSLVNDAAATITQIDTATLSGLDTDIPTSKAVGTAITDHAALRTGVHGITGVRIKPQVSPDDLGANAATVTIANMLKGIVVGTPSAARAYTLDTGANCDAGMTISTNESFDWVLINYNTTAANIITLTASAGHTIVGSVKIPSNSTTTGNLWGTSGATFRTRKTAANTFITYRIG